MGQIKESDIIHCYIDLSDKGNNLFLNRSFIHDKLSNEVGDILKRYGIRYSIEPLGEKGAGIEVIGLIPKIIKYIIGEVGTLGIVSIIIPQIIKRKCNSFIFKNKARAHIGFSIVVPDSFQKEEFERVGKWVGEIMTSIKNLNDVVCKELNEKYPLLVFDQGLGLSIPSLEYWISFEINAEQQGLFNKYRLLRLFRALKIREQFYSIYRFTRFFLISREDGELKIDKVDKDFRTRRLEKKYFMFFSSNILKDLF